MMNEVFYEIRKQVFKNSMLMLAFFSLEEILGSLEGL